MKLNRITALFFALLMLATTAIGCSQPTPAPGGDVTTAAPGASEPADTDGPILIPEVTYENMTVIDDAFVDELWSATQTKIDAILSSESDSSIKPAEGGTAYYISSLNGDDKNDGLTPETAWKTDWKLVMRTNNGKIKAGDVIYFERGGIYRLENTLKAASGVSYSAYGEGPKPIITVSRGDLADPSYWKQTEENPNVWKTTKLVDNFQIANIVFNGGELQGERIIYEYLDEDVNGRIANAMTGLPYEGYWDLHRELQFDYVVEGDTNWVLYLYCSQGNPGEVFDSIEFCRRVDIMYCGGTENVTLDNLAFMYTSLGAVQFDRCKNGRIQNCEFGYIGGSDQDVYSPETHYRRWAGLVGNAIQVWAGCDGFSVDNCYIHHTFDEAITTQSNELAPVYDIHYTNNVITHCRQAATLWGVSDVNVIEYSNNDCWYSTAGIPAQMHNWYGENEGAIEFDFRGVNFECDISIQNNLFAFANDTVVVYFEQLSNQNYTIQDNVYVAADTAYIEIEKGCYSWGDDETAAILKEHTGDSNIKTYVYLTDKCESQRVLEGMTVPADVKVGDVVTFGAYEQDADETNGMEAIEWIVLSVEDGKALLLSKYVLDCQKIDPFEPGDCTWASCELQRWLNGYFLPTAFTVKEAAKLNTKALAFDDDTTPFDSSVFILSIEELLEHLGEGNLTADPTAYALSLSGGFNQNLTVVDGHTTYWTRDYGTRGPRFYGFVSFDGVHDAYGAVWNGPCNKGIRPAVYVTVGE